ncbi:MAG: hypothetical protein IKB02_02815 [Clostridia bacterium]|nr:hypothetical protein [Clostridia bacterium]
METERKNETADFLDRMYKNVKMGSESIITLMPKVKDDGLRSEMTAELSKLDGYTAKICDLLGKEGRAPKEENIVTRLSSKMGINMNTMLDSTSSHIAEMMMEGYTMGITDMTKDIREAERSKASEASLKLAREIVSFHEDSFSQMKKFL